MKEDKLIIIWNVTQTCNGRCLFCSYGTGKNGSSYDANKDEIMRMGALLSDYGKMSRREIIVCWMGGEPLLWKDISQVSTHFKTEYRLHLSLTTNGAALQSGNMRQLVLDHFDEIVISIDGLRGFHDRCRDQKGLFALVIDNLRLLHEEKVRQKKKLLIKTNTILMRGNIEQFEELSHYLSDCGINALTFNVLGGKDRPEFYPDNFPSRQQISAFIKKYSKICEDVSKKGLRINGSSLYLNRIAAISANIKIPINECNPGKQFLFISEHGIISPCRATVKDYGISLSKIETVNDIEAVASKLSEMRRERLSSSCSDCICMQEFGKFDPYSK